MTIPPWEVGAHVAGLDMGSFQSIVGVVGSLVREGRMDGGKEGEGLLAMVMVVGGI